MYNNNARGNNILNPAPLTVGDDKQARQGGRAGYHAAQHNASQAGALIYHQAEA